MPITPLVFSHNDGLHHPSNNSNLPFSLQTSPASFFGFLIVNQFNPSLRVLQILFPILLYRC
ncbi:hypothetical protein RchiOBHm_Chr3g0496931 [Rosa chinensis]|uniref:Uncharacterized protein n=1 Tax=Rosa chinensis TaxID=74649 RepID=A0A2P6RHL8_ROSCH|nr:hypothetical protein RchiOBHm_Chr3g0496931 [Rosa chinensis]